MTQARDASFQKVIALFLLILCVLNTGCGSALRTPYTVPFVAEDITSVTVTYGTWSEVVMIEDQSGIAFLIEKMNQIEICPVYTITKKQRTADGIAPNDFLFETKDGRQYTFSATQINREQTIFIDEAGKRYEVRSFHPNEFYKQLYCQY